MPEARVDGIRLYYEERGTGAPIACIHGSGSSAVLWEESAARLGELGRTITYDRRGYSRSERPDPFERTTVAENAEDAAALLDALGAAPAVVIGRSYGGEVALDLARKHPEHVRALVLLEGAPLSLAPGGAEWETLLNLRLQQAAATAGVDAVGRALIDEVLGEEAWPAFPEEIRRLFTANGPAILAETHGTQPTSAADWATVAHPTLLVAATDSLPLFRAATEALAAVLPNARSALVGGGHVIDPAGPDVLRFVEEALG